MIQLSELKIVPRNQFVKCLNILLFLHVQNKIYLYVKCSDKIDSHIICTVVIDDKRDGVARFFIQFFLSIRISP
jgi:hypothetical protein